MLIVDKAGSCRRPVCSRAPRHTGVRQSTLDVRQSRDMTVRVNGDARDLPDGQTVRALVVQYNLDPAKVAVELNRRLPQLGRADHPRPQRRWSGSTPPTRPGWRWS